MMLKGTVSGNELAKALLTKVVGKALLLRNRVLKALGPKVLGLELT